MRKRRFLVNAAVMTASAVLLRLAGLWFRSVISGKIGASGMGLYQLIFSVFSLGVTACTSGIGLAMTRLVAEGRGTRGCILRCMWLGLSLSFVSAGVLFFTSDFIAVRFMGSAAAARPLRILAPGLPFIAVCACLKGYFFAVRNTVVPVCGDIWEQVVTIGVSVALLDRSALPPLDALMLGSTLGEVAGFVYIVLLFRITARRRGLANGGGKGATRLILHIAAPMLLGSFVRSSLSSAENILIPIGLRKYGAGSVDSLAQYGVMQGMAMPILFFPLSFVSSLAMLLIPEIAEENAGKNSEAIRRFTERAFRFTLTFAFLVAAVFIAFAEELGMLFFGSAQAGNILRIMAPIAPLMYLDNVVDNMLKGLDQQMYSLGYNFSDSMMRVALISAFVPMFGIKAYIVILFISEIYNASLSINRLLKVTSPKVDALGWVVFPAVSGALLCYVLLLIKKLVLP
jgi:stage V sporulation protein B